MIAQTGMIEKTSEIDIGGCKRIPMELSSKKQHGKQQAL